MVHILRVSKIFEILGRDNAELGQISEKDLNKVKKEFKWETIPDKYANRFLEQPELHEENDKKEEEEEEVSFHF